MPESPRFWEELDLEEVSHKCVLNSWMTHQGKHLFENRILTSCTEASSETLRNLSEKEISSSSWNLSVKLEDYDRNFFPNVPS